MGFEEENIVVIRPLSLAAGPDGFWLGKILQLVRPNKIQVHWLDKKRKEMKWTDAGCKWEPQAGAGNKLQTDTVDIDVVGFQVQLNKSGALNRQGTRTLEWLNYRNLWFQLPPGQWDQI